MDSSLEWFKYAFREYQFLFIVLFSIWLLMQRRRATKPCPQTSFTRGHGGTFQTDPASMAQSWNILTEKVNNVEDRLKEKNFQIWKMRKIENKRSL